MRSKSNIAVLVACASVAVAGCGSSSDGGSGNAGVGTSPAATTAPATSAASTPQTTTVSSPKAQWASKLCNAMAGKIKPIQPPSVSGTSPAETQAGLVTFVSSIVTTETAQIDTLKSVGPPPGPIAKRDYEAAISKLKGIQKKVSKVETNLKATSASNQKEITAVIADLGTQLKSLSDYQGPVVELSTSKAIGAAVTADPACRALA